MEILQHIWGATPEGEAIVIYTIRNANGCEVQLCNIGASIVSVKSPDRDAKIDDIVLGYKEPMSYFGDGAASGKSVGRVANRIAKGKMTIEGVEYNLEINNGPNHLHGGSKGFANQLWESRVETNRVVFSRTSEDGEQNYPGELYVEAGYYFSDDNELEITYMARCQPHQPRLLEFGRRGQRQGYPRSRVASELLTRVGDGSHADSNGRVSRCEGYSTGFHIMA